MAQRIAVVGSNNVDLITYVNRIPGPGETLEAPKFQIGNGGKGANQAVAAARLGADVLMVSKVGDDLFADSTVANLAAAGIDVRHVGRAAGVSSGVAPIFVEPSGENRILIVKGANDALSPADIDAATEDLSRCRLILLQLEIAIETVYYTLDFAARHGIEVLLNPAPALPDLDPAKVSLATFLVPNESELAILTGLPTGTEDEVEAAARALIAKGNRTVIVTMGARGALLVTADGKVHVSSVPVTPKDTTGAGDAFIGAFARYYVDGFDPVAAVERAVRYAADSITRLGTQSSYATEAAFEALLTTDTALAAADG